MKSNTEQAQQGERGEIVIRGKNVMKGYYKNEKASKEVLRDGWLWTGDLGYYDEDGFLVVTGRAKALLIASDGEKFSPEEVEEAVINHSELVNQVLVYNDHKTFTGALVTVNTEKVKQQLEHMDSQFDPDGLLKMIQEDFYRFKRNEPGLIPQQWVPEVFEIIPKEFSEDDGLINSTMKMVRYKVIEMYQDRLDGMYADKDFFNGRNREAVTQLFFS